VNTRRQFLIRAPLSLAAAAAACRGESDGGATQSPAAQPATPGAPVAFNTAPPVELYQPGSWGPSGADKLVAGRTHWREPWLGHTD